MPRIHTIVVAIELVTDPETGRRVPDAPAAWRRRFVNTVGDYWVAGGRGANALESVALQFIDTILLGATSYRLLIGTATDGALQQLKAALGNRCLTGPEAAQSATVRTILRTALDAEGKRKVRALRMKSGLSDISFVAPTVVSGHDQVEAALPDGVERNEVEVEDDPP